MRVKKIFKSTVIALLIIALLGIFLVERVLPYAGIKPYRRTGPDMQWYLPQGTNPENYGLKTEHLLIATPDSLKLSAMLIESLADTTYATVIVLHGISGCKETQLERAQALAQWGYASLLLDLRAHGESQGAYCTFGYWEKNDIKAVADTLEQHFPGRPVGIWGASLGGAVAIQAMADEPRISFGIVESTFDEFEKVAAEYGADWMFGLKNARLTRHVLEKSGEIACFDPFSVKPVKAAAHIDRPVMFIHGDADDRIPIAFGEQNYLACPAALKRWIVIKGGGHNDLWRKAGEQLRQNIAAFLTETRQ